MSLLKCHECSNEVSSEAKACPKCGAKVKKPTSLIAKIVLALLGVAILSSLSLPHGTSKLSDAAVNDVEKSTAVPKLPWEYSTTKDDMSGKDIAFAEASSLNREDLHWPYGPGVGATLTLRKAPRSGKAVYVSLSKGQILCRSYESCTVMVRFDDRPATKYSAIGPSDGSTNIVFIQNYAKFFLDLKRSSKVLVELPLYQDGDRSWQFKVDGLSWQ
jgi:DNA-directed RNA polymerase subunit RPC12/RpoP